MPPTPRARIWRALALAATLVVVAGSGVPARRGPTKVQGRTAVVRRGPMVATVALGGDVSSMKNTNVGVEVEQLSERTREVVILTLVPEGSLVKKGEILCTLDASGYVELVDEQAIEVEKATVELRTAELDREAARLTLREFEEGLADEQVRDYETRIMLADSEARRSANRADWTAAMLERGYLSLNDLHQERRGVMKNQIDLADARRGQSVFRRYTSKKNRRDMESKVDAAEEKLRMAELAHRTQLGRLDHFRKQVALCTIRAPHDGFVVYDDGWWSDDQQVKVGTKVFLGKALINLPELDNLTVLVQLHESIYDRVKVGMPATVRVAAIPDRDLRGHVAKVAQLPERNWFVGIGNMSFIVTIAIDEPVENVLPGMSADVSVVSARKPDALIVPSEAVRVVGRRARCRVVGPGGVVDREVTLGLAERDEVEILSGLTEGEVILIDPAPSKQ